MLWGDGVEEIVFHFFLRFKGQNIHYKSVTSGGGSKNANKLRYKIYECSFNWKYFETTNNFSWCNECSFYDRQLPNSFFSLFWIWKGLSKISRKICEIEGPHMEISLHITVIDLILRVKKRQLFFFGLFELFMKLINFSIIVSAIAFENTRPCYENHCPCYGQA